MSSLDSSIKPVHIDSQCPDCQSELVLLDALYPVMIDLEEEIDFKVQLDEWACPQCKNTIHFDKPEFKS